MLTLKFIYVRRVNMPKISKVVDLTKVNRRHSEIVFKTSKCDALHLEVYTGMRGVVIWI